MFKKVMSNTHICHVKIIFQTLFRIMNQGRTTTSNDMVINIQENNQNPSIHMLNIEIKIRITIDKTLTEKILINFLIPSSWSLLEPV